MSLVKNFAIVALIGFSMQVKANVWNTENTWDDSWEQRYTEWVAKSWDDEVFMREGSILKGIATDCADASYTMRLTFSYLNKLPFQIYNNSRSLKARYITNDLDMFDSISNPDDRFREFVKYVNEYTSSGTLGNDTYPVAINRQAIRPGIVYVSPNDHTYQIIKLNENGVVKIMSSTVPKDVRYLSIVESFPFYMPKDFEKHRDGYRAFKQPQHYSMNEEEIPGYSLEQYELSQQYGEGILEFGEALAHKLQLRAETDYEKTERGLLNLCSAVQLRAITVAWTIKRRADNGERCFSAKEYDNESTPSRDKRIKMIYEYLNIVYQRNQKYRDSADSFGGYSNFMDAIFSPRDYDDSALMSWCEISKYGSMPKQISLKSVYKAIKEGKLVSDPNANILQRWGQEDYNPTCPQY